MASPDQTHNTLVEELLQLQARQRVAHLTANAASLVDIFADDFINIANGQITRPPRAESLRRFQAYFDRVTFLAWDDITPPLIHVADDASLATVIVHKHVHVRYSANAGAWQEEETTFAWQETYVREHGRWRLAVVVSTNAQSITRPATIPETAR
jgi:hypothetical protein